MTPLCGMAWIAGVLSRSIQLLLKAGAKKEASDMNGDSPLAWASWRNRPAHILECLCYGDFSIYPIAAERSLNEAAQSWGGMERHLLGTCH